MPRSRHHPWADSTPQVPDGRDSYRFLAHLFVFRQPRRAPAGIATHERCAGDGSCAKTVAHRVESRVEALSVVPVNGKLGLHGVAAGQLCKRDADESNASLGDGGRRFSEQSLRDAEQHLGAIRRGGERARSCRLGVVGVAEPQDDGATR